MDELEQVGLIADPAVTMVAIELLNSALASMAIYLTVISGYLAMAFIAGSKLSRSQLVLVNSIFVVFSLFFGVYALISFWGSITVTSTFDRSGGLAMESLWVFDVFIGVVLLISIIACLNFMQGIRSRNKSDDVKENT